MATEPLGPFDEREPDPTVESASPGPTSDVDADEDLTGSLVALSGLPTARLSLEDLLTG